MRNPKGYAFITDPEKGFFRFDPNGRAERMQCTTVEFDTFSCGHCGIIKHVRPKERPEDLGGFCRQCMTPICLQCLDTGRCDPLEKKLERAEKRDIALRSYGL